MATARVVVPAARDGLVWRDSSADGGLIQRLDPRLRVGVALAFAVVVVSGRHLSTAGAGLALAVMLAILARLPPLATFRRMITMDFFIVAMLLMLPFTIPGDALFQVGGFGASREGLLRAVDIALKANAVILAVLTLIGTLDVVTLGHALHHLRVPDKLTHLFLFTVRYVEVLNREYLRLRLAMKARAFTPRGNWHTWRGLGYLFGMLLVRSLDRSERIVEAMKCRGFQGRYYLLDHFAMTRADVLFGIVFGGCLLALVALEHW